MSSEHARTDSTDPGEEPEAVAEPAARKPARAPRRTATSTRTTAPAAARDGGTGETMAEAASEETEAPPRKPRATPKRTQPKTAAAAAGTSTRTPRTRATTTAAKPRTGRAAGTAAAAKTAEAAEAAENEVAETAAPEAEAAEAAENEVAETAAPEAEAAEAVAVDAEAVEESSAAEGEAATSGSGEQNVGSSARAARFARLRESVGRLASPATTSRTVAVETAGADAGAAAATVADEPAVVAEPAPPAEPESEAVAEPEQAAEPVTVTEPEPAQTKEPAQAAEPTRAPVLTVTGLHKRFGDTVAVDGVGLDVREGSFYGIVGPNGAGKTTTLSMVTGLLRPDAGQVVVHGVDVWAEPVRAKHVIGVLPDKLRLFDRLTGAQLLHYAGTLRGLNAKTVRARSADLAVALGIEDALDRLVTDYSAGMTKKIALAAAMIHSPRLLVLDEPFESVDPVSAANVIDILQRYTAAGGTVVLSSHGMDFIERVCDSVAIIVRGKVLASGTIDEVRGEHTLEERFVDLAGGRKAAEGMEWLHSFSD